MSFNRRFFYLNVVWLVLPAMVGTACSSDPTLVTPTPSDAGRPDTWAVPEDVALRDADVRRDDAQVAHPDAPDQGPSSTDAGHDVVQDTQVNETSFAADVDVGAPLDDAPRAYSSEVSETALPIDAPTIEDATTDAMEPADEGTVLDASTIEDSAERVDEGTVLDAVADEGPTADSFVQPDEGTLVDTFVPVDEGVLDTTIVVDLGPPTPVDSGVVDVGADLSDGAGGGSCAASPDDVQSWTRTQEYTMERQLLAVGPNEVWHSVGAALRRWNGQSWVEVSPQPPYFFGNLAASSPSDVWMYSYRRLAQWDGTVWHDTQIPSPFDFTSALHTNGPTDAWASFRQPSDPAHPGFSWYFMHHWDGSTWTKVETPLDAYEQHSITDIWGSSAGDVWATGSYATTAADGSYVGVATILHWNGQRWSLAWSSEPNKIGLWSVKGTSANDVWVGGHSNSGVATAYHFDGQRWSAWELGRGTVTGFWAACPSNYWASIKGDNANSTVLHFDGAQWQSPTFGAGGPTVTSSGASAVTGTGPDDVWVSGYQAYNSALRSNEYYLSHWGTPRCGDGVVTAGEQCDPSRVDPEGRLCTANCTVPTCGNGTVDPGETCDPPNVTPGRPFCDQTCHVPTCGNGHLDEGETCDPPNGSTCNAECQGTPIACGDGFVQPGEACDSVFGCTTKCQWSRGDCAMCVSGHGGGDTVCTALSGTERINCTNAFMCMFTNFGACAFQGGALRCYMGGTGQCARPLEVVAHSHDPVEVERQIRTAGTVMNGLDAQIMALTGYGYCSRYCYSRPADPSVDWP